MSFNITEIMELDENHTIVQPTEAPMFAPAVPLEEMQLELELLTDTDPPEAVIEVEIIETPEPEQPADLPEMSALPSSADREAERKLLDSAPSSPMDVDNETSSAEPATLAIAAPPAMPVQQEQPAKLEQPAEPVDPGKPTELAEEKPAAPTTAQRKPAKPDTVSPAAQSETRATPRAASPAPSAVSTQSQKRSRTTSERSAASSASIVPISDDEEELPAKKRAAPAEPTRMERWNEYAARPQSPSKMYHPLANLPPRDPNQPFPYKNHTGFDKRPKKANPTFLDKMSTWVSGIKMSPADYSPSDITDGYNQLASRALPHEQPLPLEDWLQKPAQRKLMHVCIQARQRKLAGSYKEILAKLNFKLARHDGRRSSSASRKPSPPPNNWTPTGSFSQQKPSWEPQTKPSSWDKPSTSSWDRPSTSKASAWDAPSTSKSSAWDTPSTSAWPAQPPQNNWTATTSASTSAGDAKWARTTSPTASGRDWPAQRSDSRERPSRPEQPEPWVPHKPPRIEYETRTPAMKKRLLANQKAQEQRFQSSFEPPTSRAAVSLLFNSARPTESNLKWKVSDKELQRPNYWRPEASGLHFFWEEGPHQRMLSAAGTRPISPELLQVASFKLSDLSAEFKRRADLEAKLFAIGVRQLVSPECFTKDLTAVFNREVDPRLLCHVALDCALDLDNFVKRVESEVLKLMGSPQVHPARELAAMMQHVVACHLSHDIDTCMSLLERLNLRLVELAVSKGWTVSASAPRDAEATSYPVMGTQHPKESILALRQQQ